MYKIYINESPLILCSSKSKILYKNPSMDTLIMPYIEKKKQLFQYIDLLEKSTKYTKVIIHHPDKKKLWQDFKSLFELIIAAGGVVVNDKDEVLMIHRRGYWDLPKGKREIGETNKECAVREVMEECGLQQLELLSKLTKSYHVYRTRGKQFRMLKKTVWFRMYSNQKKLVPQKEEKIDKVEWASIEKVKFWESETYNNITEVIAKYVKSIE